MQARTGDSWNQVTSTHYDATNSPYKGGVFNGLASDLAPKTLTEKNSRNSRDIIPRSFAFTYGSNGKPNKPKTVADQMAYSLDYHLFKDPNTGREYAAFKTGRTIAIGMDNYLKNKQFFEKDDAHDNDPNNWYSVGHRQKFSINVGERYGERVSSKLDYFVMGTSDVLADKTLGKWVTPIHMKGGNFQDVGLLTSRSYNVKKSLESLAQDRYGSQLVEGIRVPEYTGYINRRGTAAAVGLLADGSIAVFQGSDAKKYVNYIAEKYGIDPKDVWELIALGEEATHIRRESYRKNVRSRRIRIKEERETKEDLDDSIDAMVESAAESHKGRFRRIRKAISDDIENVEINYANDSMTLESKLLQEAYDRGYEGEAAQKYVSERKSAYESKPKKDGRSNKYSANKKNSGNDKKQQENRQASEDGADDESENQAERAEGEEGASEQEEGNTRQASNSE